MIPFNFRQKYKIITSTDNTSKTVLYANTCTVNNHQYICLICLSFICETLSLKIGKDRDGLYSDTL